MMVSLEKKPAKGGTPMIARYPNPNVAKVIGMTVRSPP